MRKSNFKFYFDKLFWAIIALLPVIFYIFNLLAYRLDTISTLPTFYDIFLNNFNIDLTNSVIYSGLVDLFGSNGIVKFLDTTSASSILVYITYICLVELLHLFIDFVLILPRLLNNWCDKIGGNL